MKRHLALLALLLLIFIVGAGWVGASQKDKRESVKASQTLPVTNDCAAPKVVVREKCVDAVECPSGTTLVDYKDGAEKQYPICKGEPTGCPYGDSIPLGPECDKHKPVVESTTPTPVTEDETEVFFGK